MDKLMQLLMKKGYEGDMSDAEIQAKMEVLQELMQMAEESAGSDVGNKLKKITVASPSEKGLEIGLKKAQQILPEMGHEADEEMGEEMNMDEEDSEDEMKRKMMKMKE